MRTVNCGLEIVDVDAVAAAVVEVLVSSRSSISSAKALSHRADE